jgi:hypothetical protein
MIARGGKAIYGANIGILMLEARFPRIPGDMGNALSWPFPVHYRVVRGASPDRVVRHRAEGLLDAFIEAGRELVADGADGITTNCGFLSLFQAELAEALAVPVATSSLMQAPLIQATLPPGRRVGILTISAETMTAEHLAKAGVPDGTPVMGTEGRIWARSCWNAPTWCPMRRMCAPPPAWPYTRSTISSAGSRHPLPRRALRRVGANPPLPCPPFRDREGVALTA